MTLARRPFLFFAQFENILRNDAQIIPRAHIMKQLRFHIFPFLNDSLRNFELFMSFLLLFVPSYDSMFGKMEEC